MRNKQIKIFFFLLILLILVIIFCTIRNTNKIYTELNKIKSDINITLIKKDNNIQLSGIYGSKDMLDMSIDKLKLYDSNVTLDKYQILNENNNTQWRMILDNIVYYFSTKIENGKIQYSKNNLNIKLETLYNGVSDDLNDILNNFSKNGIKVEKEIKILKPSNSKVKAKVDLYDIVRKQTIEFETGKAELKENSYPVLDKISKILIKIPDLNIIIEGHTDSVGSKENNKILSLERANLIKDYFVKAGFDSSRFKTKGYGQSRPVLPNTTAENRQKNRRVEFKID